MRAARESRVLDESYSDYSSWPETGPETEVEQDVTLKMPQACSSSEVPMAESYLVLVEPLDVIGPLSLSFNSDSGLDFTKVRPFTTCGSQSCEMVI